tara:strand:+ start:357 stop:527 length:171 start_codon:yes stop_codon:yes gene_type:complete
MNKFNLKNKKLISWFFWLILVILWNYGYPKATPFQDVAVAVALSLIFIFFDKFKKN